MKIPKTVTLQRILIQAEAIAERRGDEYVGAEHALLAMLNTECLAGEALSNFADGGVMTEKIVELMAASPLYGA